MASLTMVFGPSVWSATAAKSAGSSSSKPEKGPFDWILGGLQKEDQLLETDPVLNKVGGGNKNGGTGSKTSVAVPPKKKNGGGFGGFGGLFTKKD